VPVSPVDREMWQHQCTCDRECKDNRPSHTRSPTEDGSPAAAGGTARSGGREEAELSASVAAAAVSADTNEARRGQLEAAELSPRLWRPAVMTGWTGPRSDARECAHRDEREHRSDPERDHLAGRISCSVATV
jgi:hypothetical protein